MRATATTVYLVLEETGELEANALVDNVNRIIRVPIRGSSLAGYCALSGRPFLVEDAYGDLSPISSELRFDRSWDEAHDFRTRDVMCAPAVCRGRTVGVVQVLNCLDGRFTPADLENLVEVARIVG